WTATGRSTIRTRTPFTASSASWASCSCGARRAAPPSTSPGANAVFSAVETAVSHARDSKDMWCSVSAFATIWGLHGMRRGGAPAAVGSALLGTVGILALHGIDHWGMVWQSRRA
ncbi:unnamed protein product, partial [Urochloa humidicola]